MPRVSVLVNTYNHERFIAQAIESVCAQTFPASEMEVVVVDDGSTDRTPEIVQKFAPRARLLRKKNGGQASAFNAAIPELHGELIAFLDGDDWWAPEKLSAVVEAFEKNPGIPAVGHAFFDTDAGGTPTELVTLENQARITLESLEEVRRAAVGKCLLATSKLTVRRFVLERLGPIPEELFSCADEPVMDAALALGGAILLEQPLCYYRYHSANMFGFDSADPVRNRRRYEVQQFLSDYIPRILARLGVAPELISVFLQRAELDIERFGGLHGDGGRRQVFRAEMKGFRQEFKNPTAGYLIFKAAVGALALALPPKQFHRVRNWYAKKNLRRFREAIGRAEPIVPEICRRIPLLKQNQ